MLSLDTLQSGDVLKLIGSARTYRIVEKVSPFYIYTRKPNWTPHRIPVTQLDRWELQYGLSESFSVKFSNVNTVFCTKLN